MNTRLSCGVDRPGGLPGGGEHLEGWEDLEREESSLGARPQQLMPNCRQNDLSQRPFLWRSPQVTVLGAPCGEVRCCSSL